ncbi:hypothetical protein V9L05_18095 [Bernardetia sp. Wsw4-3y2]|uniref:hypothetical protein n=1 Tax=Bernardetia sp. Wsw4-3y2 TaxID=3127471 RepID=UPI0030D124C8
MLARELKTRFKKKTNEFIFFIQAQTIKGNSYTCQITNEEDMKKFKRFCEDLMPLILADNQFPQLPFENDSLIVGIKFSEGKDRETQELIQLVQFTINYHVDDKSVNGKTVPNTIKIPLINRDYNELPDQMVRMIENLKKFLSSIAEKSCKSEYRQGTIFDNNDYKVEIKTSNSPFDEVEKATQEITGSAAPQEQIEGMKAAANERVKERQAEAEKLGVPVEIREEEL